MVTIGIVKKIIWCIEDAPTPISTSQAILGSPPWMQQLCFFFKITKCKSANLQTVKKHLINVTGSCGLTATFSWSPLTEQAGSNLNLVYLCVVSYSTPQTGYTTCYVTFTRYIINSTGRDNMHHEMSLRPKIIYTICNINSLTAGNKVFY